MGKETRNDPRRLKYSTVLEKNTKDFIEDTVGSDKVFTRTLEKDKTEETSHKKQTAIPLANDYIIRGNGRYERF